MTGWLSWSCNGATWRLAPDAAEALRERLNGWDPVSGNDPDSTILKDDGYRQVTMRRGMVVKRMAPRSGVGSRLRFALRPSRARRACELAAALRAAGLPVAEPLAYGWVATRGVRTVEMVVTRWIPDTDLLTERLLAGGAPRAAVLRPYGELLGRFHQQGFSNRDLKDENVLCSRTDPVLLWVADMDGVRRRHRRLSRWRSRRDWRAVTRSLVLCGCDDAASVNAVAAGYNAVVPGRLRMP